MVWTVTDLALHEGGRGQACADGVTEAALGVQALAGTALTQCSGAEVHVLCWRRGKQRLHVLVGIRYGGQVDQVPVQDLLVLGALGCLALALVVQDALDQVVVLIQHPVLALPGS